VRETAADEPARRLCKQDAIQLFALLREKMLLRALAPCARCAAQRARPRAGGSEQKTGVAPVGLAQTRRQNEECAQACLSYFGGRRGLPCRLVSQAVGERRQLRRQVRGVACARDRGSKCVRELEARTSMHSSPAPTSMRIQMCAHVVGKGRPDAGCGVHAQVRQASWALHAWIRWHDRIKMLSAQVQAVGIRGRGVCLRARA